MRTTLLPRRSRRLRDMRVLLMGLVLLSFGCESPDRVMIGGSAMADSAQRAMSATDFEAPVDRDFLLGLNVPPYPPGVEDLAWSLIHNERGEPYGQNPRSKYGRRQHEWRLDHVRIGGRPALFLLRNLTLDLEPITVRDLDLGVQRTSVWRIEDVLVLPVYDAEERIELSRCWDPQGELVVGLGVYRQELSTIRPVRAAWALDLQEARLVEADPTEIRCRSPFGPV